MKTAPIALFVYNRPEHTQKTIEALQQNPLSSESNLFIFSDGAKNTTDEIEVKEVRNYLKTISGFNTITIIERLENLGLAISIITGVTDIITKHGKIILLEDDLVVSEHFLQYMNEGLDKYENKKKVISIHGYTYPTKKTLPQTFFLKGADCWGWATWKKEWTGFEQDGKKLLDNIKQNKSKREFNFNYSYPYLKMLQRQIKGKNNSWAIRWYASAFLQEKLTLYPGKSLVKNIGFDGSGTHCSTYQAPNELNFDQAVQFQDIVIEENKTAKKAIENYFWKYRLSIVKKIIKKIKHKLYKNTKL